jgi:hypothetical protein
MTTMNSIQNVKLEGFTQKDVESILKQITYRKAYAKSEKARARRKERAERMKKALAYVREQMKGEGQ